MHTYIYIYIYYSISPYITIYHLYTSTNHHFSTNKSSASAKANIPRRRPSSWAAAWLGFRPSAPPRPWAPWCAPGTCATSATRHRCGTVGVGEKCWEKHGRSGTLWGKVGDVGALRDIRERAGSLEDLGLAFWMNYGEFCEMWEN